LKLPEVYGLLISWITISLCFSVSYLISYPALFYLAFLLSAASAGLGFILHEMAHRNTAKMYGCHAYYQVWWWGIVLALAVSILTQGQFIFAALGAVYISPMAASTMFNTDAMKRVYGIISLAGPSMNLLLVAAFYVLSYAGGLFAELATIGVQINLWLAAFNLIPIPPFDGSKIFKWSKLVWAIFTVPAWLLILLLPLI
jgi:Zn-dependent protease